MQNSLIRIYTKSLIAQVHLVHEKSHLEKIYKIK